MLNIFKMMREKCPNIHKCILENTFGVIFVGIVTTSIYGMLFPNSIPSKVIHVISSSVFSIFGDITITKINVDKGISSND